MCRIKLRYQRVLNQLNAIILSQVIEFIPIFLDRGALCCGGGFEGMELLRTPLRTTFCLKFGKNLQKIWANGGGVGSDRPTPHIPLIGYAPVAYGQSTSKFSNFLTQQNFLCKKVEGGR